MSDPPLNTAVTLYQRGMTLKNLNGLSDDPDLRALLARLDTDGDGRLDAQELQAGLQELVAKTTEAKRLRAFIIALVVVVLVIVGANCGLAFAMADLTQKVKSGNGNALVSRDSGATLRTASGLVEANYRFEAAAMDTSNNITSVLYTLTRASVNIGCMLFKEGKVQLATELIGPPEVYGPSSRPRSYVLEEVVGCTSTGIASNVDMTAILSRDYQGDGKTYFHLLCSAATPSSECTVSQYTDGDGFSLELPPLLSTNTSDEAGNRRRLLGEQRGLLADMHSALLEGTLGPSFVPLGMVPEQTTRRTLALAPAAAALAASDSASDMVGQQPEGLSSGRSGRKLKGIKKYCYRIGYIYRHIPGHPCKLDRMVDLEWAEQVGTDCGPRLRGLDDNAPCTYAGPCEVVLYSDWETTCMAAETGKCAPGWSNSPQHQAGRRLGELSASEQAALRFIHKYASPEATVESVTFMDCIICTHLASVGYLPADVAKGDKAFADWTKAHWPDLHSGYLLYARYVVSGMKRSPVYESLVAQLARPWAEHMAWRMRATKTEGGVEEDTNKDDGAKPSVAGALMLLLGVPPTAALGWSLRVLPHDVVEAVAVWVVLPAFHVLGAVLVGGQMLSQALMGWGGAGGAAGMVGASAMFLAAAAIPLIKKLPVKV